MLSLHARRMRFEVALREKWWSRSADAKVEVCTVKVMYKLTVVHISMVVYK